MLSYKNPKMKILYLNSTPEIAEMSYTDAVAEGVPQWSIYDLAQGTASKAEEVQNYLGISFGSVNSMTLDVFNNLGDEEIIEGGYDLAIATHVRQLVA
jgi:hypothetical protein